jgi:hypothetical protein
MTKLAGMYLLLLATSGCSTTMGGSSTDAGATDAARTDAGAMTTPTTPADSGISKPPRSRECRGTISGALTGTFRCTVSLDRFAPRAKLVFTVEGAPTGSFTAASIVVRPGQGEFTAPRSYQQYDLDRDTLVEIEGGGKTYLTGGLKSVNGDALGLELRSIDPVSVLSGYYDMPNTNGNLNGVLVDDNASGEPDGGAESVVLHIEF